MVNRGEGYILQSFHTVDNVQSPLINSDSTIDYTIYTFSIIGRRQLVNHIQFLSSHITHQYPIYIKLSAFDNYHI